MSVFAVGVKVQPQECCLVQGVQSCIVLAWVRVPRVLVWTGGGQTCTVQSSISFWAGQGEQQTETDNIYGFYFQFSSFRAGGLGEGWTTGIVVSIPDYQVLT